MTMNKKIEFVGRYIFFATSIMFFRHLFKIMALLSGFAGVYTKVNYLCSFITVLMILNHALSGIVVSMVLKYADNIVKVFAIIHWSSEAIFVKFIDV
uniref:Uncharacterized protein n=1 Tax=Cucumis melo TaxID=3656 RepID=A0A9I9E227_CUCME